MKTKIIFITTCFSFLTASLAPQSFAKEEAEEVELEMVTILGIETNRISQVLRNHVDIPDGVGLTISHVGENTGAQAAGLQQFDILVKVDDQIIVNQEQLSTYIRSKKAGDTVKIEILRKGKRLNISVALSEREAVNRNRFGHNWDFPMPPIPNPGSGGEWNFNFNTEEFQKRMEEFSKHAAEMGNRAMQFIPEIIIEREEEDGSKRITTIGRGPNKAIIQKNNLRAEVKTVDGVRHYLVKEVDAEEGKVIYQGEEPSEEELGKLSEEVQALIKRLDETKSFDWKNMEKIKKENIRVIINTGEEEASIPVNLDGSQET